MEQVAFVKRLSTIVRTADFDFVLPPGQIAAVPAARRDHSRLMLLDRVTGTVNHAQFKDIVRYAPAGALLVLNDTRVIAARLSARKPTGGAVELLLTHSVRTADPVQGGVDEVWEALARGLGRVSEEVELAIDERLSARVIEKRAGGTVVVRLRVRGARSLLELLDEIGEVPLPPYIEAARRRAGPNLTPVDDRDRYQTVYAAVPGAVAAPTAGLHFTPELLGELRAAGCETATVTLHVGPGTFRPVEVEDPRLHRMDVERYHIPRATADAVARARAAGRAVLAVGTTAVRALEASARAHAGDVVAGDGATDLMLLPGEPFQVVTALLTNFHMPRSTLIMLVAAFAGREAVLGAYAEADAQAYRFGSYGDAMIIMGTLGGSPNPPAAGSGERSSPAPAGSRGAG
jgi:S-adenosylmethionine:tRNA ribosyltransferase-isomerase